MSTVRNPGSELAANSVDRPSVNSAVNSAANPGKSPATLRLALIGHGRMAREVERLAPHRGFDIQLILTSASNVDGAAIHAEAFRDVDVCIDFTNGAAVAPNIRRIAAVGTPIVVGTTGWNDRLGEVREIVAQSGIGFVYGANFSLGVQVLTQLVRAAAEKFAKLKLFSPYLIETHHQFKKDAPSGTALELARQAQPWIEPAALPITSVRAGHFPGTHEFGWDAEAETVVLQHTARSRQAFAEGALYAARWIAARKGFFHFSEILNFQEGS
jgi:4-hydroxy-tetrahydrodipicolinate reductase